MKNLLLHPRNPLVVGTLAVLAIAGYLTLRQPMPGPLAGPHAQIKPLARLSGCTQCHHEKGFDAGCLSCHTEIGEQLATGEGYHPYLLKKKGSPGCQTCHAEHLGAGFQLINPQSWPEGKDSFSHPHVAAFNLQGRHDELTCESCHRTEYAGTPTLPNFEKFPREHTFLGLSQDCVQCHQDVHSGGLSKNCADCHGQVAFRPAVNFDHSKYFKLAGPHERTACNGCHIIPEASADTYLNQQELRLRAFGKVKGKSCAECHATPHRAPFGNQCLDCHVENAMKWNKLVAPLSAETHTLTGFPLTAPHQQVSCDACHAPGLPFDQKYQDPGRSDYVRKPENCQGCHKDVHAGQFAQRYDGCTACHAPRQFMPAQFTMAQHALKYPLLGAHAAVPCLACHVMPEGSDVRQFAGTTTTCKQCHADPHDGQFSPELTTGDCSICHVGVDTFKIRPFDHAKRAQYPLVGGHAKAACQQCHRPVDGGAVPYRGLSTDCASCHQDIHRGQFAAPNGLTQCASCHTSTMDWIANGFDHNRDAGFTLDGVHAKAACSACHPNVVVSEQLNVVLYKPLGKQCKDCHGLKYQ